MSSDWTIDETTGEMFRLEWNRSRHQVDHVLKAVVDPGLSLFLQELDRRVTEGMCSSGCDYCNY